MNMIITGWLVASVTVGLGVVVSPLICGHTQLEGIQRIKCFMLDKGNFHAGLLYIEEVCTKVHVC